MMNLELLFNATKLSGDSFYHIAITHADNTIKHHYRPDYGTWHVVDFSKEDGAVRHRNTPGYADESTWARGHSWGIYGFVMCYRERRQNTWSWQRKRSISSPITPITPRMGCPTGITIPRYTEHLRDASAGAILASALYELSTYSSKRDYKAWADTIIRTLSGPDFLAPWAKMAISS